MSRLIIEEMTPILMVENVNDTVKYYHDLFGLKLVNSVPETGRFNWAEVGLGEISLMFQSRESFSRFIPLMKDADTGGTFNMFFQVADVEVIYKRVKGKAVIVHDLVKTFYGSKEFTMQDLNGYHLSFAEFKG